MAISEEAIAIGLDIGTSGARAVAVNAAGEAIALTEARFNNPHEARRPDVWWERISHCLEELSRTTDLGAVEGIAVDGTSGTVLSLDRHGQALGEVLMYNDPCPDDDIVRRIAATAPSDSPARGSNSGLARSIYLSRAPGACHVVHQADWILMKLGQPSMVSDENNALKSGYDLQRQMWPEWVELAGMDVGKFPSVKPAGERLTEIEGYARTMGVPASCHFHAGTTDGCASFLATGASEIGDGVTALGSTIVLKLASDRPINAPEYGVYAHRVLDFWLIGGASNSGGAVIRFLVGDERLSELTERLRPDRPTGLDYYPLLKPGERFPINDPTYPPRLTPRPHDDAEFFQAILEGMTEIERLGYARLRSLGGPQLRSIRTVGGGAKNQVWARMRAEALGIDLVQPKSADAAVGTASLILARRRTAE
ncbi:FGGY-family carbohydrate kinase [Rhizobium sp. BK376]|uniref:FGGY-family carbohydrate kinase n=1 Tax=Rhizobium sp. BK376 TaxID=2512149 RepID=UPI0010509871|nr:FGGY-family carbohydrate kinase [Rhizobium sp. BK376]TCR71412.1 sugar (pentulose or hexulose) kinase [Rhizobium sp. BK376]